MIQLEITWGGTVNGLSEHRLSVAAFGEPLKLLLSAIRRKANSKLREAADRRDVDVGRFKAEARKIDIEIESITHGSGGISSVVTVEAPVSGQHSLWPDGLAEDSLKDVLGDIESEGRGNRRNRAVRAYLAALDPRVTAQDYTASVNGTVLARVHLGTFIISGELSDVPYIVEPRGRIVGLGFEPGRPFIRIKTADVNQSETTFAATQGQVDEALELRDREVRVLSVVSALGKKVLRIQASEDPPVRLDENAYIFEKWSVVLERLAQ